MPAGPAVIDFRYFSWAQMVGFAISFTAAAAMIFALAYRMQPGRSRRLLQVGTASLRVQRVTGKVNKTIGHGPVYDIIGGIFAPGILPFTKSG